MLELAKLLVVLGIAQGGAYSPQNQSYVFCPESSVEKPADVGLRAHTNHMLFVGPQVMASVPSGETPASLRAVYGLPSTGGSGTIAIVDAYHYPTALNDFNYFSKQFGLPTESSTNGLAATNKVFQVVYANGRQPTTDAGWALEAALDIEWAHAMAPNARIVLVEAASASFADLLAAVDKASQIVTANGGKGEVSMSWGGSEFAPEMAYDSHFRAANVVYFAASGDTGGQVIYPGTSMYVVSAGGTKINRNSAKAFLSESGWTGSGGGMSRYEPRPVYQNGIQSRVGSSRGTPDMSFDADPNSGVAVYTTTKYYGYTGWWVVGGTSLSSPALAGVVNLAGHFSASTFAELTAVYAGLGSANYRDIVSGQAGNNFCSAGWDAVTGVGSPLGLAGK